jgi:hypothetical protein
MTILADGTVTFTGKVRIDNLSVGMLSIDGFDATHSAQGAIDTLRDLISQAQQTQQVLGDASPSSHLSLTSDTINSFNHGIATESGTIEDTLTIRLKAVVNGTLEVLSEAFFRGPVFFFADVFFKTPPTFSSDTAGTAVISRFSQSVDVVFEKPYKTPPVVSLTLTSETAATDSAFLDDGAKPIVTNVTERGFTAWISSPALRDYEYNWIAISVENKKRTVGRSLDPSVAGASTESPTPIPPLPSVTPTPTLIETSEQQSSPSASSTGPPPDTVNDFGLFQSETSASGGLDYLSP